MLPLHQLKDLELPCDVTAGCYGDQVALNVSLGPGGAAQSSASQLGPGREEMKHP